MEAPHVEQRTTNTQNHPEQNTFIKLCILHLPASGIGVHKSQNMNWSPQKPKYEQESTRAEIWIMYLVQFELWQALASSLGST